VMTGKSQLSPDNSHFSDSHSSGVKLLKMLPFVSKITVRVFRCRSHEGNAAPIFEGTSPSNIRARHAALSIAHEVVNGSGIQKSVN
jgi:hypothetical protein